MQSTRICLFEGCEREFYGRGYCRAHFEQLKKGKQLTPVRFQNRRGAPLRVRLDSFSIQVGECRVWIGYKNPEGHGRIGVNGKLELAHRVAWQLENGPIPEGLVIDHKCHTRACIEVSHLQVVTIKQNCENRAGVNPVSSTGVRGVRREPSGRYAAQVGHNQKRHYAGTFDTLEEAEAAAIALRNKLFTNNLVDRKKSA